MNYRECRKYGQNDCCRTSFENAIKYTETRIVHLEFLDGSSIDINPWVVSPETEYPDYWFAIRMQNPAYEDIDTTQLTQKSRHIYTRHHHTGNIVVPKYATCPFKT